MGIYEALQYSSGMDSPWWVDLFGSLAIVVAAVAGSWFTGRWAYRSQNDRLDREFDQARERDELERRRAVSDQRGERLRAAYSEFMKFISALDSEVVSFIASSDINMGKEYHRERLKATTESLQGLNRSAVILQMAGTPQMAAEVDEAMVAFRDWAQLDITEDERAKRRTLSTRALRTLRDRVIRTLEVLEEGMPLAEALAAADMPLVPAEPN